MTHPSVVDRLVDQATRHPTAPAVVEGDRVTSYAGFLAKATAFAAAFGDIERPRVMIASEKSAETYAAMFGCLMAGGTYAPANVAATWTRLQAIHDAFEPHVIVADASLGGGFAARSAARVIDATAVLPAAEPAARTTDEIAYVIFTSGSTGVPKGVAIPRAALDHYAAWLGPALGIGPGDRLSQHPNIGFDLSVLDIYGALCFGAALHPFVGRQARLLPARKVREERLTIWNSVPSVVSAMALANELDATHFATVRLLTFCGEILTAEQVGKIFAARPDAVVMNTYGPTEATVAMTCRPIPADAFAAVCAPSAPLGDAIGDMRLYLVGDDPDEGEIAIAGPQLAAGYWQDRELTEAKFGTLTIDGTSCRVFFTGDYARRRGGDLYFLGRRDEMVKIHGHRIDLGDVRSGFARIGWPTVCVCEVGGALLAAVEGGTEAFDEGAILSDLAVVVESYALPKAVRRLDRLPRNSNDKIDVAAVRRFLEDAQRSPGATRAANPANSTAPR